MTLPFKKRLAVLTTAFLFLFKGIYDLKFSAGNYGGAKNLNVIK